MIRCIIIEDQPPAQRVLQKFIQDIGTLKLDAIFTTTTNVSEFLSANPIDLIFLDIHLPQKSGIDFLKTTTDVPNVIMTTAFTEYAVMGFELNVIDYLVKPFSYERFEKAISKVLTKNEVDKTASIFIKSGHDFVKVDITGINFIKSDLDYTEVHLNNKKFVTNDTLSSWTSKLESQNFVRIHKSYLVNLSNVEKIKGSQIFLQNEIILPIGRAFKDDLMKKYIQ